MIGMTYRCNRAAIAGTLVFCIKKKERNSIEFPLNPKKLTALPHVLSKREKKERKELGNLFYYVFIHRFSLIFFLEQLLCTTHSTKTKMEQTHVHQHRPAVIVSLFFFSIVDCGRLKKKHKKKRKGMIIDSNNNKDAKQNINFNLHPVSTLLSFVHINCGVYSL